jgi:hypothetical protein
MFNVQTTVSMQPRHRLSQTATTSMTVFALVLLAALCANPVVAMDFMQVEWRGKIVLLATGEIVEGDAERFEGAMKAQPLSPHGVPVVLLDSPGGAVFEALKISKFLDSHPAHMVIPDGASCASACASIIFIAGTYRTVEPMGRFGQHSCSINGIPVQSCNDTLAEHAAANGVSYGSVAAFVTYVPPNEIQWFSREDVDCWGISRYPFTEESNFEKSEPCIFQVISGEMPAAQSAWRVDFIEDGYMAFLRPVYDHLRELQLDLWCDETRAGSLFLSMEIPGPSVTILRAILTANLYAPPVTINEAPFWVEQLDESYSRVTVEIGPQAVLPFLTETDELSFKLNMKPPYEPIQARTYLAGSKKALLFAANNCLNK